MRFIKLLIDMFNEAMGNTQWFECRICKTKTSQKIKSTRYLNSRFIPVLIYYLLATTVFYFIYDYIKYTFIEYSLYALGFGFLLLHIAVIFKKAQKLEKIDSLEKPKCPKCNSDYTRPIVKSIAYNLL